MKRDKEDKEGVLWRVPNTEEEVEELRQTDEYAEVMENIAHAQLKDIIARKKQSPTLRKFLQSLDDPNTTYSDLKKYKPNQPKDLMEKFTSLVDVMGADCIGQTLEIKATRDEIVQVLKDHFGGRVIHDDWYT